MNKPNPTPESQTSETPAVKPPIERGFLAELFGSIKTSVIATIVLAVIVSGAYPLIVWAFAQTLFHHAANGSLVDKNGKPTNNDQDAVGSALIGQSFGAAQYFHPRPSAAGNGYDPTASGGSNLGPTSAALFNGSTKPDPNDSKKTVLNVDGIQLRIVHYCEDNGLPYAAYVRTIDDKNVEHLTPTKIKDDKNNLLDDLTLVNKFNDSAAPVVIRASDIPADAVTASGSGLDPHISLANARLQVPRVAKARSVSNDKVEALIATYTDGPSLGFLGDAGVNVLRLNIALDNEAPVAPATTRP